MAHSDYPVSIYIDSVLANDKISLKSFSITENLDEKVNTCSFLYKNEGDTDNDLEFGIEIEVYDYASTKIFAGQIMSFFKTEEGNNCNNDYIEYRVKCAGFEKRLQTRTAAENYQAKTSKEIIVDLFATYAPDYGTDLYVETGFYIDTISFNYLSLKECMNILTKIAGFSWYVDYDKNIHFFTKETSLAPTIIARGGNFKNFNYSIDGSQLKNSIILRGGFYLDFYEHDIQVADGEKTNFLLAYEPVSPISVYVNTGMGFVQKTVGIKNINITGFDFLVSFYEKNIENLDAAKLNNGDIIKITYNRQIPVIAYGEDENSINRMKALEGGDGKYQPPPIVDINIKDLETANNRIKAELDSFSNTIIKGSLVTSEYGFNAGQLLTIDMPHFGLNEEQFLIQFVKISPKVNKQIDGSFYFEYTISFATTIKGLEEFLLNLYNKSNEIKINENEIIHTYREFTKDIILFENDETTLTDRATGTYRYNAADAKYDFAQYS